MLNAPILSPANIFIWIVCILIGFTAAVIFIDSMPKKKNENPDSH